MIVEKKIAADTQTLFDSLIQHGVTVNISSDHGMTLEAENCVFRVIGSGTIILDTIRDLRVPTRTLPEVVLTDNPGAYGDRTISSTQLTDTWYAITIAKRVAEINGARILFVADEQL